MEGLAEGFQIEGTHLSGSHVGVGACLAVAPTHGNAIDGEMLGGGDDALLLQSDDHPFAHLAHQIGILAIALYDTSPTGILRDVEYRRIDIGVSQGFRLGSLHLGDGGYQLLVPGGSLSALCGEQGGAVVVQPPDTLVGEIHGDAQPCLLDEPPLDGLPVAHAVHIGERQFGFEWPYPIGLLVDIGDAVFPNRLFPCCRGSGVPQHASGAIEGSQLTGFLFECHL